MQSPAYSTFEQKLLGQLPKLLLVDFSRVFFVLDRLKFNTDLPEVDTEAMMSVLVDQMGSTPTEYNWRFKLNEVLMSVFSSDHFDEVGYDYDTLRKHLLLAMIRTEESLSINKLYVFDRLPYEYVQRKPAGCALLRRQQTFNR